MTIDPARQNPTIQHKSCAWRKFSGVGKFSANWLDDQASSDRPRARKNSDRAPVNECLHPLQIWLEFALGDAGGLDADSPKILRLTTTGNAVSSGGSGSSKKANAWHRSLRGGGNYSQLRRGLQGFDLPNFEINRADGDR